MAVRAMGHNAALSTEVRRLNPGLGCFPVGVARLVAVFVRGGVIHSGFSAEQEERAEDDSAQE